MAWAILAREMRTLSEVPVIAVAFLDKIGELLGGLVLGVTRMRVEYREEKATQAAAYLLRLAGGSMGLFLLIKLLYLSDRRALLRLRRPITFDNYASMQKGPIVSKTYDKAKPHKRPHKPTYWNTYIDVRRGDTIALRKPAPSDQLSVAETNLLDEVYAEFGNWSIGELIDYCHKKLPEWRDPGRSSKSLSRRDILHAAGVGKAAIDAMEAELEAEAYARKVLG